MFFRYGTIYPIQSLIYFALMVAIATTFLCVPPTKLPTIFCEENNVCYKFFAFVAYTQQLLGTQLPWCCEVENFALGLIISYISFILFCLTNKKRHTSKIYVGIFIVASLFYVCSLIAAFGKLYLSMNLFNIEAYMDTISAIISQKQWFFIINAQLAVVYIKMCVVLFFENPSIIPADMYLCHSIIFTVIGCTIVASIYDMIKWLIVPEKY